MPRLRSLLSPIVVFVAVQLAWILAVVFWVYGSLRSQRRLRELAETYGPELPHSPLDWLILIEGLVLLVVILVGVYVIFLYWRRQAALYREQKRLVSQVTHELKSPLASLRLYLETIRLRRPSPEQLDSFVETMLEDTERLNRLTTNLLTANRLEHRGLKLALRPGDLSAFVEGYFGDRRQDLPEGGTLSLHLEPGLRARFEAESLSMALRNLFENALLYSEGPPRIEVTLRGRDRSCHLAISDRGRGIEPREQRKVFRMFYRVRRGDDGTQGSGLGLFITRVVVLRHKGKIWLESAGPGQGTTVHLALPRLRNGKPEEVP
ncbi:MAG: HAMP domain-containing sensor histidine kinase [Deferrisomatales bacterium]|nr:HAMP domain-containing sensor histidine kinase [Deferrisomatales bacterium]